MTETKHVQGYGYVTEDVKGEGIVSDLALAAG